MVRTSAAPAAVWSGRDAASARDRASMIRPVEIVE
jgi:hypothetical protein